MFLSTTSLVLYRYLTGSSRSGQGNYLGTSRKKTKELACHATRTKESHADAMKEGLCSDVRVGLEEGNMCWDRGVGDRTSDRVDGSRVVSVSRPGNIHEGRLGEDVRKMFAEDRDGQEVGEELSVVSPKATRVDCYPE